jgi:hypothetical protein
MAAKKAKRPNTPVNRRSKKVSAKASRDELACCPLGVLSTSLVQTLASECVLGSAEYVHADATFDGDSYHVLMPSHTSSNEESTRAYRLLLHNKDYGELRKPFLRFVGRVFEVLQRHRGKRTSSAGDVFRVFVNEIPQHLSEGDSHVDGGSEGYSDGRRRTLNNRTRELCELTLLEPTRKVADRPENYRLTLLGEQIFEGWPVIPGLRLQSHDREDS